MRLNTAASFFTPFLALTATGTNAFHISPSFRDKSPVSTILPARRMMFPILRRRRPSPFFTDFDSVFEDMDEIIESSLSTFQRPSLSILDRNIPEDLKLRLPLGFEVTEEKNEYKLTVNVPKVEAKDVELQLDQDGRVLRLKGRRNHTEGGMTIQSRFDKSILLSPDVDTSKITADFSDGLLTVVAPKIEEKKALDKFESRKIEIHFNEPKETDQGVEESSIKAPPPVTYLAVEKLKEDKVDQKHTTVKNEKKWPVRDFPY